MSSEDCPYCMEEGLELYTPSCCKHYGCKPCFEKCSKFATGQLQCPMCKRAFKLSEIVKYVAPPKSESQKEEKKKDVRKVECDFALDGELVELQKKMRYCLNLLCQKGSGCKLVHIDEIFPNPPATEGAKTKNTDRGKKKKATEVEVKKEEEEYKVPKGALYCFDLLCPGGPNATCGKKHEQDIFRVPC